MKPESESFIEQAAIILGRADVMLNASLREDAARSAYMASFHVAQAYIFERTGKVAKTHNGVQTEFFRLTLDDMRIDRELCRFLSRAYVFKSVADYFTGPDAVTSASQAIGAVEDAKRFVAHVSSLVTPPIAGASLESPR